MSFATIRRGGGSHAFMPVLDALPSNERLPPDQPLVAAYLGGRPVVLAQRDQALTPSHVQMTLPVTISRLRRALDIEADRQSATYDPSLVDD